LTSEPPDEARVSEYKKRLKTTLGLIENVWLKDTPYLTGNVITIADLLGACEIEQPSKFHSFFYCTFLLCIYALC
jgi:glutathione S-transferase